MEHNSHDYSSPDMMHFSDPSGEPSSPPVANRHRPPSSHNEVPYGHGDDAVGRQEGVERQRSGRQARLYNQGIQPGVYGRPTGQMIQRRRDRVGLLGLSNLGNTCYMNAALQCLIHTRPLQKALRKSCPAELYPRGESDKPSQLLVRELIRLFQHAWETNVSVEAPGDILKVASTLNPMFQGYAQHDTQEFLNFVLDIMHEELHGQHPNVRETDPSVLFPRPIEAAPSTASTSSRALVASDGLNEHPAPAPAPAPAPPPPPQPNGPTETDPAERKKKSSSSAVEMNGPRPMTLDGGPPHNGVLPSDARAVPRPANRREREQQDGGGEMTTARSHYTSEEGEGRADGDGDGDGDGGAGGDESPGGQSAQFYDCEEEKRKEPDNKQPQEFRPTSIVAAVFAGRVSSSIQCCKCQTVSRTYDVVYEINLPIPNKRDEGGGAVAGALCRVPRADDSPDAQPSTMIGALTSPLKLMASSVKGLIFTPPIMLTDCLRKFCTAEYMRGSEQYECDKCKSKQDGEKRLQLYDLPEVLCLHLKRFKYEAGWLASKNSRSVQFPVDEELDVEPFVDEEAIARNRQKHPPNPKPYKYRLTGIIEHIGSYGGGHYTAYVYHKKRDQWVHFDDGLVSRSDSTQVARSEPYYLFYEKVTPQSRVKDRRTVKEHCKSVLEHLRQRALPQPRAEAPMTRARKKKQDELSDSAVGSIVYVPQRWYQRLMTMSNPGPIEMNGLLCPHGRVATVRPAHAQMMWRPMGHQLYHRLVTMYGGPATEINDLSPCDTCIQFVDLLLDRRQQEYQLICEHDSRDTGQGNYWYLVENKWVDRWKAYIRGEQQRTRGFDSVVQALNTLPGAVDNTDLLECKDGVWQPKKNLKVRIHYIGVNAAVWGLFTFFHGGGPVLVRKDLNIYEEEGEWEKDLTPPECSEEEFARKYHWQALKEILIPSAASDDETPNLATTRHRSDAADGHVEPSGAPTAASAAAADHDDRMEVEEVDQTTNDNNDPSHTDGCGPQQQQQPDGVGGAGDGGGGGGGTSERAARAARRRGEAGDDRQAAGGDERETINGRVGVKPPQPVVFKPKQTNR
ncbi:unnamed protein product [Vitrella brassicaformis CCMP3155]|uniref:Uncharacterized protein n=3 Tax=Vitrella brassicaformis TaxID=1169539 RepID=A0A0G4EDN3_VITBC|nr:unnamed protein product [Vitrella brassicaformis CCMP3155]|eukprot:CEL93480.1 unnamed protein product [Vitrella brassicaformis CCMP3155]